jgi:phenylpropionate dioxygenase-like ring-hydroxylating dioxygenase large terminal subunit
VKCSYTLVVDNLLDQTHIAYVHGKTIGGNAKGHAVADMNIEATPRGMYFMRWLKSAPVPPAYLQAGIGFSEQDKIDRWAEFEFVAPASVLQFTGGLPIDHDAPNTGARDGGWALRIMHNITPETETSCHYFWAACHGFKQDDPKVTQWMFEQIRDTFKEDEIILEAQQRRLLELPGPLTATKHDAGRIAAERALQRLIKAEAVVDQESSASAQVERP